MAERAWFGYYRQGLSKFSTYSNVYISA
eukprot:SAG31_NODE_11735_length_1002_cov_1.192691_1_plen_27_part_01